VDALGYDRVGFNFTPSYVGLYDVVSHDDRPYQALGFTCTRKMGDNHIGVGKFDLTLHDVWPGRYNPKNPDSELAGLIRPMRPLRARATLDEGASYHDMMHGWLLESEDDPDYDAGQARLQFQDLTIWLEREKNIVIPSTGPIYVGEAIGLVHDAVGWVNPAFRSFQQGDLLPDFSADGQDGITIIAELLKVDLGYYYVSRAGVATYVDRYDWARRASLGTFAAANTAIPGTSLSSVRNRATSQKEGSSEQTYYDEASKNEFGFSDHDKVTSPYFEDDAHAARHAAYRVGQTKEPVSPMWSFEVSEGPAGYLESMLVGDFLDPVTISTIGMTDQGYTIQELVHKAEAGKLHRTDWRLKEVPVNAPGFVGSMRIAPSDPAQWAGYERIVY